MLCCGAPVDPAEWKKSKGLWREARALFAAGPEPRLDRLFQVRAEDLSCQDLVLAYAIACYLIEARPERLARLLEEIGREAAGRSTIEIVAQELRLAPDALDARLARWVDEMGE